MNRPQPIKIQKTPVGRKKTLPKPDIAEPINPVLETIKNELLDSEDSSGRRRSSRVRKPVTPPKDEEEAKKTKRSPRGKRTPTKVEDEDEDEEEVSEDEDEDDEADTEEGEEVEDDEEDEEMEVESSKKGKDSIYHCGFCKVDYNTDPSIKRHWRQRHPGRVLRTN